MTKTTSPLKDPSQPWNLDLSGQVQWLQGLVRKNAKTDEQKKLSELLPVLLSASNIQQMTRDLRQKCLDQMRDEHIRQQRDEIARLEAKRKQLRKEVT